MYATRDNKKIVHNRDIFSTAPQITKDAPSGGGTYRGSTIRRGYLRFVGWLADLSSLRRAFPLALSMPFLCLRNNGFGKR